MHLTSELLSRIPGLKHGFGTREENIPSSLEPEWTRARPSWKQVHGTHFVEVTEPLQQCGESDARISFARGIPATCMTADCVPVLLARKAGGGCAAIHAGWRGTYAGVVDEVCKELERRGEKLSNWVAAVGPAIRPCCYEVSEELIRDFKAKFPNLPSSLIEPSPRMLDLQAIHEARLKNLGFEEVEVIRSCTRCSLTAEGEPMFHSYRREKNNTRQYSGLVLI